MEPVVAEEYSDDHKQYAVAVVKKSSPYQSVSELKDKKACLSQVGEAAGKRIFFCNIISTVLCYATKVATLFLLLSNMLCTCEQLVLQFVYCFAVILVFMISFLGMFSSSISNNILFIIFICVSFYSLQINTLTVPVT